MSLFMFFDQGEQARKVVIPTEDQVTFYLHDDREKQIENFRRFVFFSQLPSGIWFKKRLIDTNDQLALALKMNLLFPNGDETMFSESIN